MLQAKKHKKGFTLLEMLVVIGIILGLTMVAIPVMSRFMKTSNLSGTVAHTQKLISFTRQLAMTAADYYAIVIDPLTNTVGIYDAKYDSNNLLQIENKHNGNALDKAEKTWHIPSGIEVTFGPDNRINATSGKLELVFNSMGKLNNPGNTDSRIRLKDIYSAAGTTDQTNTIKVYSATGTSKIVNRFD